ncbi:FHA domain-containing protein DDL [Rhagoletis pomonella]|uniref:FHA domain-containing protein DDL n=1 Tax=Rhagoletis pomonella TaxID=28610 RepID=UPI0017871C4D|nr:FHA domain-containing protein DDL [Rhagoletis pomonella]
MSKPKKSRKNRSTDDDVHSENSDSDIHNSEAESRHHEHKKTAKSGLKHSSKKNRSSSSSSSSTSASESSDSSEEPKASKRKENDGNKQRERSTGRVERKQRQRTRSREREELSSGDEPNVSKWDSPERRARQRSRSRQRRKHSRERERSEERDAGQSRGDRYERGNRSRGEYAGRERFPYRRDYHERYDNRNHNERWRDERFKRSDRYNDRRENSRSPRQPRPRGRSPGDDRSKREPRDHSRKQHSPSRRGRPQRRNSREDDSKNYEWGGKSAADKHHGLSSKTEPVEKEKPNFGLSGALLEDTNKVNGVVVKYAEPPEARKPKRRWRLYPFKGETALPTLHIHRQSCFLVGRDRKVADLAVDHPSCSKQHAALQYRLVPFEREDGTQGKRVRLYLIDLESANGTFLNNKKIDPRKYYEIMEKDVIKFGFSTREYVLLHENSKEDQEDDDVFVKPEPEDIPDGPNP